MKKALALFVISFVILTAAAQKKQNTYFVKNNGKEVNLRDSADYIRIIEEPDSGEKYFNIKEFYLDGSPKLIGKVSSFEPRLIYEGQFVSYYKNGIRKSSINYKKDDRVGMAFYFFENGKVKKQLEYLEPDPTKEKAEKKNYELKVKLIYQIDSLGKVYVQEGNGHLIDTTRFEKDQLVEEGDYKDGFKEGVWKGKYLSGQSSYVETYAASKFVSGVNTVGDKTYEYSDFGSPPQFKGGLNQFYNYNQEQLNILETLT